MSATQNIKPRPSCDICGKTYKNSYSVTVHKRIHTGERPYKCEHCGRAFMYRSSCSIHMVSAHGTGNMKVVDGTSVVPDNFVGLPGNQIASNRRQESFKCKYCGRRFMNLSNHNIHMTTAHKSGKHKLDSDNRFNPERFDRRPDTIIARNKGQPDISISSNKQISGTAFANNNRKSGIPAASKSRNLHMPIPSTIQKPNKATPSTYRHLNTTRTYVNNITLKSHIRMHEISKTSTNSSTYLTNSNNSNNTIHKINEHIFSISGRNIHDMVNATVNSEQQLKTKDNGITLVGHAANKDVERISTTYDSDNFGTELSQNNDKTLYKCEKCGETCINKRALAAHKCKSKRCSKCYKPFKTWLRLKEHEALMHPKSYKYTCTVCGISFKTPSDYTNHMKSHGGERDGRQVYECSVCKSKLYTKKSFIRHKRLHKRYYQCKSCKECFDTKEEQTNHSLDSHARNRPYKCPYCELTFTVKRTRDNHVKWIHKGSVQLSLDNTAPKYGQRKSAAAAAGTSYTCTQCNSSFSQEYLLRKHVMKVHWKEDNKLNKMIQIDVKRMKENEGMAGIAESGLTKKDGKQLIVRRQKKESDALTELGRVDNEGKMYACDTCGANFTSRNSLNKHILAKHLDGSLPVHAKREQESNHFSRKCAFKHAIPIQPHLVTGVTRTNVNNNTCLPKNKKVLNEAILREYYVPTSLLTSSLVDLDTDKKIYVCEICSATYTYIANLWRHINNRAYDHSFYLRKRQTIKAPKVTHRFECDVCGNTYTRRYDMFLHRRKHTKKEFKDVGAREDVYKAPDCNTVITDTGHTILSNSDQVVSSSTTNGTIENQAIETYNDDVSIDMDSGDGSELEEVEEEPLYTARPYFPEKNKDTELLENEKIYQADNSEVVHGILNVNQPVRGEYTVCRNEQIIEHNITANATDMVEKSEAQEETNIPGEIYRGKDVNTTDKSDQMRTMEGINRKNQTLSSENINTTNKNGETKTPEGMKITGHISIGENINIRSNEKLANSTTRVNTTEVQNMNIHKEVNHNELSKQYTDTVADCLSNVSTVEDDGVCTKCRLAFLRQKESLRCSLCHEAFCVNCSGLSRDVFNILYCTSIVGASGIWWTCTICKDSIPKFTQLVKQLGDFEQNINNRLTDMEHKLSVLKPKGKS